MIDAKGRVSIIIPVYNVSDYVEECLQSVAAQTYTDIECIIVDDCGTDDSMQKVERFVVDYQGPIAFKIIHHEHNRGLSAARNTGMDAATGEYIYFMDSDDYIYPNSIEVLFNAINQEEGIDWAHAKFNGKQVRSPRFDSLEGIHTNALFLHSQGDVMSCNHLYKTTFLKKNHLRFVEGLLHEDVPFSFQAACNIPKIAIVDQITYYYRERKDSICTMDFSARAPHYCQVYQEMIHYVFDHHIEGNIDIFKCINNYFKRYYKYFLWNGEPDLKKKYYLTIRNSPYWTPFQIWKFTHNWKHILFHLHRYLPEPLGFKVFQYVYAKFFDNHRT